MPQALPANPELDGLKKAANKRLAELRGRAPEAKLHQAQFAIATDYGLTSWRTLKAHIALHLAVSKNNTIALCAGRSSSASPISSNWSAPKAASSDRCSGAIAKKWPRRPGGPAGPKE